MKVKPQVFYSQNGIVVRHSILRDANELSIKLRESDKQEMWASHHYLPQQALEFSLKESVLALTIENNGSVVGMFGIAPESVLGNKATIWFLASDELENIQRRFLRHSRKFVDLMLEYYSYLYNYVDARNTKSVEWLRYLGAKIEQAKPFGIEQKPFHYFSFERK